MFHTLVFTSSVAASAVDADSPGVFDGYASLQNNHYLLPRDMKILAAYAQGANIGGAKISAPSLRFPAIPELQPVNVAAAPGSLYPISIEPPGQFTVLKTDELAFLSTNTAAAPDRQHGLYWVGDGNINIPSGNIITVKATGSITASTNVWTPGSITLAQGLPVGRYSIVGADFVGTNLLCGRIVFPTGGVKPGVIARASLSVTPWNYFRLGNFGEFGQFDTVSLPGIEIFATGANTSQTIFLDVIKIA